MNQPSIQGFKTSSFYQKYLHIISFSDLFDADNIKNFSEEDPHVSVSVHKFFKTYGGYKGLARALKTDIKVGDSLHILL